MHLMQRLPQFAAVVEHSLGAVPRQSFSSGFDVGARFQRLVMLVSIASISSDSSTARYTDFQPSSQPQCRGMFGSFIALESRVVRFKCFVRRKAY